MPSRLTIVVALLAALLLSGCGGGEADAPEQPTAEITLPLQETADIQEAAKAASCEVKTYPEEGRTHDPEKDFKPADYKTNPPTSGNHDPIPAEDGIYPSGTPELGMLVHSLEHGRIHVQYKPGTPEETVDQLESLLAESEGYHMLLYENPTGMEPAIAATAWRHSVTCPEMNDKVFDAIRTFRTRYIDKAPEQIP